MIAIVKYQKLPFTEFGEQGEKFVVHYKMLEDFMLEVFIPVLEVLSISV